MRPIDFSVFNDLPYPDRLDALSLVGDGFSAQGTKAFGITIGDRLYAIDTDRLDVVRPTFAALLNIEMGSIDRTLIDLPADPTIWEAAIQEYLRWIEHEPAPDNADPLFSADDHISEVFALRAGRHPQDRIRAMLGQGGFCVLAPEGRAWTLYYRSFAQLRHEHRQRKMGIVPMPMSCDLLDWSNTAPDDSQAQAMLRYHERTLEEADELSCFQGRSYHLALLCLERARTLSKHVEDPDAATVATSRIIMSNR